MQTAKLVATKIKKIRSFKGISQEAMAMAMNVSQSQYQRLESGDYDFRLSKLDELCKILEVDFATLLGSDENFIVQNCTNGIGKAKNVNTCSELGQIKELYERLLSEKDAQIALLKENFKS